MHCTADEIDALIENFYAETGLEEPVIQSQR